MPDRICYTVAATIPGPDTLGEYVAWLKGGHLEDVLQAGAQSGIIIRLDPEPTANGGPYEQPAPAARIVTQYVFASREAFNRYERDHAPALRADGLERFGPQTGKGVTFTRSVGTIL